MKITDDDLLAYLEMASDRQKKALIKARANDHQLGHQYDGPPLEFYLPLELADLGVPRLVASQFVSGGFLTPVGFRFAELANDNHRL